jgi:hypothetical protein
MYVLSLPDQSDAVRLLVDDLDGLVNFLGVCLPREAVIPDSIDRKRRTAHVLTMFYSRALGRALNNALSGGPQPMNVEKDTSKVRNRFQRKNGRRHVTQAGKKARGAV